MRAQNTAAALPPDLLAGVHGMARLLFAALELNGWHCWSVRPLKQKQGGHRGCLGRRTTDSLTFQAAKLAALLFKLYFLALL